MKHLLNNLSEEEKNSIREQHTDRIKIDKSKFKSLMESKLGDVKPIVEQQTEQPANIPTTESKIIGKTVTFYTNEAIADEAVKLGKSITDSTSYIGTIKSVDNVNGNGLELTVDFGDIEKKSMEKKGLIVAYGRECGCFTIRAYNVKVYNTSLKNFLNKTYYQTDFVSNQKPLGSEV
jgi:hypothetical protein